MKLEVRKSVKNISLSVKEMVPTASREEKQTDILKAAIRVFAKHGFDGAKMEYIAKEAGIGKGTVYEYFESKDRLFEEILIFSVDQFKIGLKESMNKGNDIEEKILNCSRFHAQFLSNHMEFVHIAMQVKILSEEIRVHHMAVLSIITEYYREMVREAKAKGELRADLDEDLAACCIMGTLDQFCRQRVFMNPRPLVEIDHQAIVDVLLGGLR